MPTVTPLHRLGAVLRYLDEQPPSYVLAPVADIRALLVGDLAEPTHVAMRADRAAWLDKVASAAETVTWGAEQGASPDQVAGLRNVLNERPDGAA